MGVRFELGSLAALVASLALCGSFVAQAQAPRPVRHLFVYYVGDDESVPAERRAVWHEHVEQAARTAGFALVTDIDALIVRSLASRGHLRPARLAGLAEVERLLSSARVSASMLEEDAALSALAHAAEIAETHADVPGAAQWLAEVETTIGIVAAQAGHMELAGAALARASQLDPGRGLRAAEASPQVVELALRLAADNAQRPTGRFQVSASAEGAHVFLDDAELGLAPQFVRARVGRHVLRVEADGYLAYGRVLDVLEGARAPLHIELAPDPARHAADELPRAALELDVSTTRHALHALDEIGVPAAVWWVEVGTGPADRALLTQCSPGGCDRPRRLEVDAVPIIVAPPHPVAALATLAGDRQWLDELAVAPPVYAEPLYDRWYVWALAGAIVAGSAAVAILSSQPEPQRALQVRVDFGELDGD